MPSHETTLWVLTRFKSYISELEFLQDTVYNCKILWFLDEDKREKSQLERVVSGMTPEIQGQFSLDVSLGNC